MATTDNNQTPSTSKRTLVIGAILLVLGLILVGRYALEGVNTPVEGNAPADAWQASTVIGAALFTGVGALLIVVSLLKRRSLARRNSSSHKPAPESMRS
jgi:TRAP-type C4-dicarboxylate transport system permease small subunit